MKGLAQMASIEMDHTVGVILRVLPHRTRQHCGHHENRGRVADPGLAGAELDREGLVSVGSKQLESVVGDQWYTPGARSSTRQQFGTHASLDIDVRPVIGN
jgi:hypothetical protein